jgi:hypothetical protein
MPLAAVAAGKAGMRLNPESGYPLDCSRRGRQRLLVVNFSDKEKDEASLLNRFQETR